MTELERLKKKVADTKAAYVAAYAAWVAFDVDNAWVAADAWKQAKLELNEYLKEQDND